MERLEQLRQLLKQKEDVDRQLAAIRQQIREESGLLKKPRKSRKPGNG
ncbi:hypothetical protein [Bradyrhizobium icense]|nr:hypothetical protein [Bradyrhizobium icense]